jgi:hypothetical protein
MWYDDNLLYSKVKVKHETLIPVSRRVDLSYVFAFYLYHHGYTILGFINAVIDIVLTGWKRYCIRIKGIINSSLRIYITTKPCNRRLNFCKKE